MFTYKKYITLKYWKDESHIQNARWYVVVAFIASILQIWWIFWTSNNVSKAQDQIKEIKSYIDTAYNKQSDNRSIWAKWNEFINMYFEALTNEDYDTACGFESKKRCDKNDSQSLTKYAIDKNRVWFSKWNDWEHIKEIWIAKQQPETKNLESWCVKSEFTIKWETTPVVQIMRYDLLTRPNNEKQISIALCEKTTKNWIDKTSQMKCWHSNICTN